MKNLALDTKNSHKKLIEILKKPLSLKSLRHISNVDIADYLSLPHLPHQSDLFESLLNYKLAVPVLSEMEEDSLKKFLKNQDKETLVKLFSEGPMDDLVYLMDLLKKPQEILSALPPEQKTKLEKFRNYPKDSTGRIMQEDYFSLPLSSTVEEGIKKLREYSREKFVHYIYAVDDKNILKGVLSIRQLSIAFPQTLIKNIINENVISLSPHQEAQISAQLVSRHNFIAIPVVDPQNQILGLITVDDVLDIIEESANAQIYAMAGLPEDDRIYTSTYTSIKNRLPWLTLNLLFAVLASSIISWFEQSMNQLIILATLKNIVAGIGGNTAIQTLTVTTRGLDTGDFRFTNFKKALRKESLSGLVTGSLLGVGAGLITWFWKDSLLVSLVIFLAMLLTSVMAVWAGLIVPLILRKLKKDPAVSSGVIVTVITDIFGFFIFLGMASLGLKFVGVGL